MSCTNCGSPFHERWACTKGVKAGLAVTGVNLLKTPAKVSQGTIAEKTAVDHRSPEATIPSPPLIVGKRRGRPQTITDMKAYKAKKERERRAKLKNG